MTALRLAFCWVLAAGVALWVLWRVFRGRPAIARGVVTSRAVHIAALVLVLVGATGDRGAAQPRTSASPDAGPAAGPADFPATLRAGGIEVYARLHRPRAPFAELGGLLARIDEPGSALRSEAARTIDLRRASALASQLGENEPGARPIATALESALERARHGRRHALADLHAILDAAEQSHAHEAWLATWVWRRSGDVAMTASQRAGLLARIDHDLRVAEALERAAAQSGGVRFVPWLKKSMAPASYHAMQVPPGLVADAERLYSSIRLASWEDEAAMDLVVDASSAGGELWRRGVRTTLVAGVRLRLGRLDVVATPVAPFVVRHAVLGRITVPVGTALHAWGLPSLLDATQRARIQGWIASARHGDAAALRSLEATLPASHALVRADLAARPTTAGAARLRTALALFDE